MTLGYDLTAATSASTARDFDDVVTSWLMCSCKRRERNVLQDRIEVGCVALGSHALRQGLLRIASGSRSGVTFRRRKEGRTARHHEGHLRSKRNCRASFPWWFDTSSCSALHFDRTIDETS